MAKKEEERKKKIAFFFNYPRRENEVKVKVTKEDSDILTLFF